MSGVSPGGAGVGSTMNVCGKGSVMAYRRQEEFQRLKDIDAYRLWQTGRSIVFIAGRAGTTERFVVRWLREVEDRLIASPVEQTV
jgi:hypothetical protein